MNITIEQVLKALEHVMEPELKKDIVSLGFVSDILIKEKKITFTVSVQKPTMHGKKAMEDACVFNIKRFLGDDLETVVTMKTLSQPVSKPVGERETLPNIKHIIAVASGKGGVGKSTIAVNLAAGLAKKGFSTGIVDADIYGPSVPLMMDVLKVKPTVTTIEEKQLIVPVTSYGVKILSIGFFAEAGQAVPWRGPMASKALVQMFRDADWGELDFMIVDLPPGTGDIHLSLVQSVPLSGAIVVSTPQPVALADAIKAVNMFRLQAINVPVLGLVENMAYFSPPDSPGKKYYLFGKEGVKRLAIEFGIPLLAEIPLIEDIREGGDVGKPAVLDENSIQGKAFMGLVKEVMKLQIIKK